MVSKLISAASSQEKWTILEDMTYINTVVVLGSIMHTVLVSCMDNRVGLRFSLGPVDSLMNVLRTGNNLHDIRSLQTGTHAMILNVYTIDKICTDI